MKKLLRSGIVWKNAFALSAVLFAVIHFPGCKSDVTFLLLNSGNSSIDSVAVFVTGNTYQIGSMPSHRRAEIQMSPKSDSHIEIQYVENGNLRRQSIDCYIEPHYTGKIEATLLNDGKLAYSSDVHP